MAIETPKLKLLLIQEDWKFADDSFNLVIADMDNKLLGIAHAISKVHWDGWRTGYSYAKGDIVRTESCKSNQYYLCVTNGISGVTEPTNNVTGSIVDDGTVQWKVCILGDSEANASVDIFRGGLAYTKGQLVLYNEVLYRCKVGHVAALTMELDNSYWQQVDASLQPWKTSVYFFVDDIVVYNDVIYKCTTAHTSGYTFDYSKWTPLTLTLIEDWATSTEYVANQVVLYNGILYRALDSHTSDSTDFATDLAVPHWEYICASIPDWTASEGYLVGQVVLYQNRLYKCKTAHTATSTFDPTKWIPILASPVVEEWQVSTNYLAGQLVLNSDMLLRAIDDHISDSTSILNDMDVPNSNNHWELVYANIASWQASTDYKEGAQVIYNNNIYRCNSNHTSASTFNDSAWTLIGQTNAFIYNWQASKYYYAGQVVVVDKELYRCDTTHTSASDWSTDKSNWTKISAATIIENWASGIEYLVNEVVTINGILYRCTTAHTSTSTFDTTKWTPVYANIVTWAGSTDYRVGELVIYNNQIYKCKTAHTSTTFEADATKWQTIANNIAGLPAWASGVYYYPNQVVKYNGKIWRCLTGHTSGAEEKPDLIKVFERTASAGSSFFVIDENTSLPEDKIFDIGSSKLVNRIRVEGGDQGPDVTFELHLSNDGTTYTKVGSFTIGNHSGYGTTLDTYSNSRYVKVRAISYFDGYDSGGKVYLTKVAVWADSDKWEVIVDPDIKITYWAQNTNYKDNEIVLYQDEIYRCLETHNSGTSFDVTKWKKIPELVVPNWTANTTYKANQIVFYDGKLYKCVTAHTSTSTFDMTKWTPVNDTIDTWTSGKNYYVGQVVWYNNILYRVIVSHTSGSNRTPLNKIGYENTGVEDTYTSSTTLPVSLVIDLGKVYDINSVYFEADNNNAGITDFAVGYSLDNTNWTDENISLPSGWMIDYDSSTGTFFDGVEARYIRVVVNTINSTGTPWQVDLKNFKINVENIDDYEEISTMNILTDADIDELFI